MLGDSTISDKTRDRVRDLCEKAGVLDKIPELDSEEAAQAYIEHLQRQMRESEHQGDDEARRSAPIAR